ncbi:hypothetical protein C2S53_012205 [Perilla frutescens var. hirtella]|uniref:C2H2-type domain-containing protein n=1 Tax=Perilla frutescens var. hirtella TaxID=608512 RepID=A0AAD4IXG4_PERFH|nr:hypothetical protein C2S53_012205 [Perilla frutescens var. hirtella]
MACIDDQQPTFKHYCRVCKKGFMCGRALGGHMRAHGIGDENGNLDDDDNASDWEDKFGGERNTSKRMYQLRTNPNRLKSCRTCENCGKEFLSWKSFLEHGNGKCSSDDASESLLSSPDSDDDGGGRRAGGWSKRKRSLRSKVGSDDLLLASCLVQLANTTVDLPVVEPEESCASASKEEERRNSSVYFAAPPKSRAALDHKKASSPRGLFECKACKKVFNSHQALGGHRASHKKVKGCYAAKQDYEADNNINLPAEKDNVITNINNDQDFFPPAALVGAARRKSKVHECSICHRVFNSGQALGGHKRCHWIISNSPETSSVPNKFQFQHHHHHHHHNNIKPTAADVSDKLDLNVPAWAHMSGVRRDPRNPLSFDVSTDHMHLQPWNVGHDNKDNTTPHSKNGIGDANNNNNNVNDHDNTVVGDEVKSDVVNYVDDEADSKLKLAKLSDLNDTNAGSSQWLQVGIGSTSEAAAAAAAAGDA